MADRIQTLQLRVNTAGSAGSATGTTTSYPINGTIEAVQVDFNASAPATTDLTIEASNPNDTILSVDNTVTDTIIYPRKIVSGNDGVIASGNNYWTPFVVQGTITVALAQSDALTDAAVVRIYYR